MCPATTTLVFRRAVPADREALRQLFAGLRVQVAGSTDAALQLGLIRAAESDPAAVLMVADSGNDLLGLGLAVIDPRRFWRRFVLRHPWLLFQRSWAVVRRRMKAKQHAKDSATVQDIASQYLHSASGRKWGESSRGIAHVLLVSLRPEFRSSGAGSQLFAALLDELAARGVSRFDSRIDKSNLASVRMCHRMGIRVEEAPGSYFVTADLPWRQP